MRPPNHTVHFRLAPLLVILLGYCLFGCSEDSSTLDVAAEPAPSPLVVVGVDGATWDIIDPMIARGELPNFEALTRRGTRADLISILPLSSPAIWTTFATGRFARHHNLLDHTYPFVAGPKRRVVSTLRRVPALWNIASHYSRTVAVIGYFATHPPEIVTGAMLSDWAARGAPGAIYPEELADELKPEIDLLTDEAAIREIYKKYLPWSFDLTAIHRPEDPYHTATKVVRSRVHQHAVYEDFNQRVALRLATRPFDLFMVYLRMPDHASHATWFYFDDSEFDQKADPHDKELLGQIIPAAYRDTDAFLGQLLQRLGDQTNLVVLSDHGFGPAAGEWGRNTAFRDVTLLSGTHRPNGIFLASGPDIRQGRLDGVTIMDIAPTLLTLLALPISEELPGRVERQILRPGFFSDFPERETTSYRMRWQTSSAAQSPSDEALTEDLKVLTSLGYLSEEPALAAEDEGQHLDFWSIEPRLYISAIQGELMFHLLRDDPQSASEVIDFVREQDPVLATQLPRMVGRRLKTWQESFDFPLR